MIGNDTDIASLFRRVKDDSYPITPGTIDSGIEHLKALIGREPGSYKKPACLKQYASSLKMCWSMPKVFVT
jgi:hypothetical protein